MPSSVPAPIFTSVGFSAPPETDILVGRIADYVSAFAAAGGKLNPALNTPQGQLATADTAIIGDAYDAFLALVNNYDPAFSSGRYQDAIGRYYFQSRNPSVATAVACVCTGAGGTIIPAGARAQDQAGNIYAAVQGGTIPGGPITLQFANIVTGAIACAANTLTLIYQTIPGWDAVNNPADGVLGNAVESAAQFENRRKQSVAGNANGTIPAIRGAVLKVAGVIDAYVTDNTQSTAQTINGVSVPAYGTYVCVAGGSDADVARAMWSKKQSGGPWYTGSGATTVTVLDNRSTYATPPSYSVSFQRATALAIKFQVVLKNSVFVPSNALALIQAAIISAIAGGDGQVRATIGSTVFASRFYADVAKLGTWAQIIDIQASLDGTTWANSVAATMAQIPTVAATDIALVLQ